MIGAGLGVALGAAGSAGAGIALGWIDWPVRVLPWWMVAAAVLGCILGALLLNPGRR